MRVDQIMSREIVCCRPEDTLDRAAEELWRHDCGCLPVVDPEGVLCAMVTDRDMCMAAFTTGRALQEIRVRDCMSPRAASCCADDAVAEAARTMATFQVRRLPVVDGAGRVCGLLSVNDLLRSISRGTPAADALTVLVAVAQRPGDGALEATPGTPSRPAAKPTSAQEPTAMLKPAAPKKKPASTKRQATKTPKARAKKASPTSKKRPTKKS